MKKSPNSALLAIVVGAAALTLIFASTRFEVVLPEGSREAATPRWSSPAISTSTPSPAFYRTGGWWESLPTPVPAFFSPTPSLTPTPTSTLRP